MGCSLLGGEGEHRSGVDCIGLPTSGDLYPTLDPATRSDLRGVSISGHKWQGNRRLAWWAAEEVEVEARAQEPDRPDDGVAGLATPVGSLNLIVRTWSVIAVGEE